ncbi:MAG TPA: hypothetical protein VGF39_09540 [Stellaceae bacterium]|jgi:hypothetical protein
MKPTIDLSDIDSWLDDPQMADRYKLARAFGAAVRKHFRGRSIDHLMVIGAATAAIQSSLREFPASQRHAVLHDAFDQLACMIELMDTILKPAEGTA